MTDAKRARRLDRYRRLLARGRAALHETSDPAVVLLDFPGERRLRCARSDIGDLRRDGSLTEWQEDGQAWLRTSADGEAALRRGTKGDFTAQHRTLHAATVPVDGAKEAVVVNAGESPLAILARKSRPDGSRWLETGEFTAGERLRRDFELAAMQPRLGISWDFSTSGSGKHRARNGEADLSDGVLAARDRVHAALDAVGPELAGALLDICCFLKGLEQVERERGWPRRSAKLMLKAGLSALDRHYHPVPPAGRRNARMVHWGAEGFRPSLRPD